MQKHHRYHAPNTMEFSDNCLMIRGTPEHFSWYSTMIT